MSQGLQYYAGIERYDPTVCDTERWAAASAATLQRSQSERAKAVQMLSGTTPHVRPLRLLQLVVVGAISNHISLSVAACRHGQPDQHGGDGDLGPMEQHERRLHAPCRRDHRDQEQVAAASAQGTCRRRSSRLDRGTNYRPMFRFRCPVSTFGI